MTRSLHRLSFLLVAFATLGCGVQSLPIYNETDGGAGAGGQGGGQAGSGGGQGGTGAGGQGGSGGTAGAMGGAGGAIGGSGGAGGKGGTGGTVEVGEGESCGGFRVGPIPDCMKGLFCELPAASCNIADVPGKCAPTSLICPAIYDPVCGCDGKTYGNDCERRGARAQLAHKGACKRLARMGEMCAGIAGIACDDGLFCDPAPGLCGAPDAGGTCQKVTNACTREYAPVCGCDGKTYANNCVRLAATVGKKADGPCAGGAMRLAPGQWGGVGAHLIVKDPAAGGAIEFDCAHGTIEGPLDVGPDGLFKWRGTWVFEGGPVQNPPPPGTIRPAAYWGKTAGDMMSLQVIIDNGGRPSQPLTLTLGKVPFLRKCQ